MPTGAAAPTPLSIITSALRKIGALGSGESTPDAEDLQLGLDELNEIAEMWNLRKRKAFFQFQQAFTFTTSKQSYQIGNTQYSPDFVVTSGDRPARIEFAQLVLTDESPNVFLPVAVINVEQYQQIAVPALSSQFPLTIYYQPTWPTGTIYPYPAFPTSTAYQLNLVWWNQFLTFDISQITTTIVVPFGYRRALSLTLAEALYLHFPKKTDLAKLEQQARQARNDMESVNQKPPVISTTDGIGPGGSSFDWRSRQWQ